MNLPDGTKMAIEMVSLKALGLYVRDKGIQSKRLICMYRIYLLSNFSGYEKVEGGIGSTV